MFFMLKMKVKTMFHERLRSARKSKKLKLQEMADCIAVALRTYQGYEGGTRFPSPDTLVKIADTLDVSIDWLLGRDEWLQSHGVSVDEYQ